MRATTSLIVSLSLSAPGLAHEPPLRLPPRPEHLQRVPHVLDEKGYVVFVSWDKAGLGSNLNLPKHTHSAVMVVRRATVSEIDENGKEQTRELLSPRVMSFLPVDEDAMRLPALVRRPVPGVAGNNVGALFPKPGDDRRLTISISYPIEISLSQLRATEARLGARGAGGAYTLRAGMVKGAGIAIGHDNCYSAMCEILGVDISDPAAAPGSARGSMATVKGARVFCELAGVRPGAAGYGDPRDQWINDALLGDTLKGLDPNMCVSFSPIPCPPSATGNRAGQPPINQR